MLAVSGESEQQIEGMISEGFRSTWVKTSGLSSGSPERMEWLRFACGAFGRVIDKYIKQSLNLDTKVEDSTKRGQSPKIISSACWPITSPSDWSVAINCHNLIWMFWLAKPWRWLRIVHRALLCAFLTRRPYFAISLCVRSNAMWGFSIFALVFKDVALCRTSCGEGMFAFLPLCRKKPYSKKLA